MRHLISLGCRCDVAFQLRMHGSENVAHFFDWLATPAEGVIKIIEADFDVFHPDHLIHNTKHKPHCVEDALTGVLFHHQFPMFAGNVPPDFLLFYQPFISKFQHLANRFREYLRSRPVTLVRQDITEEQALRLEQVISSRFPDADLRFLYVLNSGTVFQTPRGHARLLKNDWSSLGDPAEWSSMMLAEGLTESPYRHATEEILGAAHDDHNLLPDNRFREAQLLAAIEVNPRSPAFALELSRWYTANGMPGKAEEMAVGALARDRNNVEAQFLATLTQWRNGRIDAQTAAEVFRAVADTPKPRAFWLRETANAIQNCTQHEEALIYATRAISIDPLDRFNYLQKASILLEMNRLSSALLAMEAAVRLGAVGHVQQHRHALILQGLGRLQEALDVEQSIVTEVPGFFPARFKTGELLVSLERTQEGLEAYRAALPLAGAHAATVEDRITALTKPASVATPSPVEPEIDATIARYAGKADGP